MLWSCTAWRAFISAALISIPSWTSLRPVCISSLYSSRSITPTLTPRTWNKSLASQLNPIRRKTPLITHSSRSLLKSSRKPSLEMELLTILPNNINKCLQMNHQSCPWRSWSRDSWQSLTLSHLAMASVANASTLLRRWRGSSVMMTVLMTQNDSASMKEEQSERYY